MRRVAGYALVFLGALAVVVGFMAPSMYTRLATVPLDYVTKSTSSGQNMSVLYLAEAKVLTGVTAKSVREVKGIPGKAKDGDAFWQTGVTSSVDGVGVLSWSNEGVSVNRVSGEATNCCGDFTSAGYATLDEPAKTGTVEHQGQFFKFPFNVQQTTYKFWDGDLGRAEPIAFQRVENIEGTSTYVFQQKLGPETVDEITAAPGSIFGVTDAVDAKLVYENVRTLWVEPETGVIIKGVEEQNKRLEGAGVTAAPVTVGTIGYDDATISANAKDWGSKGRLLGLIRGPLKPIGIVSGLLLLAGGLALLLLGRRSPRHVAGA
jgi:hypothetical protein